MIDEARCSRETQEILTGPYILQREVMILFNSPVHHYVTPKFYTETKPSTGKVVPTWNYAAVEAYGTATIYVDHKAPESIEFLGKQIRDLSYRAETGIMGNREPWSVEEAPEKYIELLKKNIMGIEIEVKRLGGKFKMSQEIGGEDVKVLLRSLRVWGRREGGRWRRSLRKRTRVGVRCCRVNHGLLLS